MKLTSPELYSIFLLPLVLFILNVFFVAFGTYDQIVLLDEIMHVIAGLVLSHSFLRYLEIWLTYQSIALPAYVRFIISFLFVSTLTVFWELGEYALDQLLGTRLQDDLNDTMKDQLLGMVGALGGGLWSWNRTLK